MPQWLSGLVIALHCKGRGSTRAVGNIFFHFFPLSSNGLGLGLGLVIVFNVSFLTYSVKYFFSLQLQLATVTLLSDTLDGVTAAL